MVAIFVQEEPGDRQGTTSPGPPALLPSDHLPRLHHSRGLRPTKQWQIPLRCEFPGLQRVISLERSACAVGRVLTS